MKQGPLAHSTRRVVSGDTADDDASKNNNRQTEVVNIYPPVAEDNVEIEVDDDFKAPDELLQAQALANLLDTAVKIPFVNFRVGLDFLIGLIPGIGDTVMLLASMRVVYLGTRIGMPGGLVYKMIRNAVIDYGLGFVPILGDIVDMFFKANQRNVRIMETWWVAQNKAQIDALAKRQLQAWEKAQSEQQ